METIQRRKVGVSPLRPNPRLVPKKTRPYAEWRALPKWQAKSLRKLAEDDPQAYAHALALILDRTIQFYKKYGVIIRDARRPGKKYIPGLVGRGWITLFEWRHALSCPHGVFWKAGILYKDSAGKTAMMLGQSFQKLDEWLSEDIGR